MNVRNPVVATTVGAVVGAVASQVST
ncbi:MAG: hypothetical protein JWM86_2637, partial [Thermoleophilia bacterium]|nr:hypothetical protein [Thermoleophilia bacterium]